ncbi:hypothetical protein Hypma_008091 [Hypsizygus marmoreus]|uniref:Uncharacterized protein n=1 Tax=Hypsizygus marmoreus TaxID=39966 RepID=A0A369K3A0_HYPMA|nr:hypothetical protein Hypma_008091 [Hypsizygus marmoreus]
MMDLAAIQSKVDLIQPIAAANHQLAPQAVAAIASTALVVAELQSGQHSAFISANLVLLPSSAAQPPNQTTQDYLHRLVLSAESAAASISCSSILAGAGSESDDTGDIALWLGPGDFGEPQAVLQALGLAEWASAGEIASFGLSLPANSTFAQQLASLQEKYCFRVREANTGSLVLFFLVGRMDEGWAGLLGVGTWSD